MKTPRCLLPEIRLRSSGVVPPIRLLAALLRLTPSMSLPRATFRSSTFPTTPCPGTARKDEAGGGTMPRSPAASRIAPASGCSLPRSNAAARRRTSPAESSAKGSTETRRGLPSVSVPVLSTSKVSTRASVSSASALRTSTPACAPRPVATMMLIGVARPRAHGHAMISTDTAFTKAWAKRGSGPSASQPMNVAAATAITAGTNQAATRSASRWMGARLRCASETRRTICASRVPSPTRSARMRKVPLRLTVPPVILLPGIFSTGNDSPVIIDSSTLADPSRTTPSTGTLSPGRTRSTSPGCTSSSGTSRSSSLSTLRAVFGARPSSARSALRVRARARSSSTWPSSTSVTMAAAGSKYTGNAPCASRTVAGSSPGAMVATTLKR